MPRADAVQSSKPAPVTRRRLCIACQARWRQIGDYCRTCKPKDYVYVPRSEKRVLPEPPPQPERRERIFREPTYPYREFSVVWDGTGTT